MVKMKNMMSTFWILILLFLTINAQNYTYDTKYITVPVDHFSFTNNATFQLRYLIKKDYWRSENGPIFFYTGNEGDINMFAQNTGFIWDIAAEFSALIVFAEHRYYGESLPFANKSYSDPQHLGYLTSSQALADFVDLINYLQLESPKNNPVIAFGGSYGGMLSAWLRMKYPHIVTGAISSSAPILQFDGLTPCGAYSRIVTSDFRTANPKCVECIKKSWKEIRELATTDAGKSWLSTEWALCKPIKTQDDLNGFIDYLTNVYGNLAMINYPYATNFLAPIPAYPIKVLCSKLQNATMTGKTLVTALKKALSIYTNYTGNVKCLDIESTATSSLGEKGWDFQACTEMVMPMCTDGENDMFEVSPWNFKSYSDHCYKKWSVRPQKRLAISEYGGRDIYAASNIVFSNGLLDPWSAGGVLHNMSRSVFAVLIPEAAHHLDLRANHPNDPQSVIQARNFHKHNIRNWIQNHHFASKKYFS